MMNTVKITHTASMSRTTGYTATAAANMFLEGLFLEKGVFPPELVGKHEVCFKLFFKIFKRKEHSVYRKIAPDLIKKIAVRIDTTPRIDLLCMGRTFSVLN